jgi:hypothetical protein
MATTELLTNCRAILRAGALCTLTSCTFLRLITHYKLNQLASMQFPFLVLLHSDQGITIWGAKGFIAFRAAP